VPLLVLLGVLALGGSALAAQAQPVVRIGTWNLEFFGNRRDHPQSDADIARVAEYVRRMGVDVLAVQEVATAEALTKLTATLGQRWLFVLGSTGLWRDGGGGQRLGFVWNDAHIQLLQAEELLDLPRETDDGAKLPIFHRVPVCAAFRARSGGLDFRAVTVHLKADNRRDLDQHQQDETSTSKRLAEVTLLGGALRRMLARPGEDQDLVVLGDFNHVLARERSTETAGETKVRYDLRVPLLSSLPDFVRLAPAAPRPTIRWFPEAIDHIVVSPDLRDEAIASSLTVRDPFEKREPSAVELDEWQQAYSDHFPLTLDLRADRDADPTAIFAAVVPAHELRPGGWAAGTAGARSEAAASVPEPVRRTGPTKPAEGPAAPLRIGQHVEVATVGGQVFTGTLLGALEGDWVQIDQDRGGVMAFPIRNVLYVAEK